MSLTPPSFNGFAGLANRPGRVQVQELPTQGHVEPLDEHIFGGFSRSAEVHLDMVLVSLKLHHMAEKVAAVALEHPDHARP